MSSDADRLQELHADLEAALEERITQLLSTVKAAQMVSASIAATNADIHRNEQLKASLEAELSPLQKQKKGLESDNTKLQKKADQLKAQIEALRTQRKELVGQVKGLAAQAKSAGEG